MKLSATIGSERPSKKQTGVLFVSAIFANEEKSILKVTMDLHGFIYILDKDGNEITTLTTNKNGSVQPIAKLRAK